MSFSTKTERYPWKNITVILKGRPVSGATNIEYNAETEIEPIFELGQDRPSPDRGSKKYSGTIELPENDYKALVNEAKRRRLKDVTCLELSIVITYVPANSANAAYTAINRLAGVKLTGESKSFQQGASPATISLPFVASRLETRI